ncbi:neuronal membrane glycoprotein M6-a isoform X1 [Zeugodacus cucurbitae]|uniref:Neuronal membrane glycoprotein M6-b n=1 Tax=Zeugodacus cucurbitae TaxID=28588 RepID=A0A0A1WYN8_ZEUCU|nr:neuronal membrane glycoprotein M6-a isoform X1 [Zeugodacus cucurbitae]XP_011197029.1 neuronal membrane glycoprotein M6-a isoform X1 [Zeugodacus cucurbitae]
MPSPTKSLNQRDRIRDPREDILLETNFEDDGILTRAYNNNPYNAGTAIHNRRRSTYRSDHSLDRYTERGGDEGDCCQSCMSRIPYATLIATLMCLLGVGIFCGTMYRGASLTVIMMDQVFHLHLIWIEAIQMIFVIIAAGMAALGFMILFIGFLATGATRYKVYRAWRSRVGGRISCAAFMGITYLLNFIWILILCFLVIVTFIYTIFWNMCSSVERSLSCIDLTQFHFMFPPNTKQEDMKICDKYEIKAFCKDGVENAEVMFILATLAALLVILSLVHYLMCLAANYAHIRDHEKFQELQEIQNLNELEYSATSKDRF